VAEAMVLNPCNTDVSLQGRVIVKNTFVELVAEIDEEHWLASPRLVRQLSDSVLDAPNVHARFETWERGHRMPVKDQWSSETSSVCAKSDVSTALDESCLRSTSLFSSEGEESDSASASGTETRISNCTTLMLRNVPHTYNQNQFRKEIDDLGFASRYDFLYLPIDQKKRASRGFAFMNFITVEDAADFHRKLHGRRLQDMDAGEELTVAPAELQGFEANVTKYLQSCGNRRKKRDSPCEPFFLQPKPNVSHDNSSQRPGRFCPFCGKKREIPGAKFCGYCGEVVAGF
jgi:hypothetical protein